MASQSRTVQKKDFEYQATAGANKQLPMLFGANFNDDPITRTNLRKSHALNPFADHEPPETDMDTKQHNPHTQYDFTGKSWAAPMRSSAAYGGGATGQVLPRLVSINGAQTTMRTQTQSFGGTQGVPIPGKVVPVEEQPLKFLGYFTENIAESADELQRVRRVAIHFYASDKTIVLRETAPVNSGLPGGVLLKRQHVPVDMFDESQGCLTLADLDVGTEVTIFGKKVVIVDAPEATRRHLIDNCGRAEVADALPWPQDADTFGQKLQRAQHKKSHARREMPTSDFDNKRALEAVAGTGVVSKHAPADVRSAQQFFKQSINAKLSFAALWDDRGSKSGDLRRVVLRYYLENDTVEVVEQRPDNAGREGGNKLLMRQRVPKPGLAAPSGALTSAVQQNTYGLLLKNQYLTHEDLDCGKTVVIAGRPYYLYDSDTFTREWYMAEHGIELSPPREVSDIIARGATVLPKQYPPPHTGIGSEEDSLQSWRHLTLKPPRKDDDKLARELGKVMLFRAVFAGGNATTTMVPKKPTAVRIPTPPTAGNAGASDTNGVVDRNKSSTLSTVDEDRGREFLISFHRATDEVEVQERQIRNSGIVGGKFLAKGKHKKVLDDGRKVAFAPSDFYVGAHIALAGRVFELVELDELSRRICDGEEPPITGDRIKELVVTLKDQLNAKFVHLNEAYRGLAPEGVLTTRELMAFFAKSSGPISEEEAMSLVHYFAPACDGLVPFDRFVKMMDAGNTTSTDEAFNSTRAIKGVTVFQRPQLAGTATTAGLATKSATQLQRPPLTSVADDTVEVPSDGPQGQTFRESCVRAVTSVRRKQLKTMLLQKIEQRRGTVLESYRVLGGHSPNARLPLASFETALKEVLHVRLPESEQQVMCSLLFDTEEKRQRGIDFKTFAAFAEDSGRQ